MALGRRLTSPLLAALLWAAQAGAQDATGTIRGRVLDGPSQQPLVSVNVVVEGTTLGASTRDDGSFVMSGVPAGAQRLRVTRIGYAPQTRDVTVTAGAASEITFTLERQATVLEEVVSVGYGTQRREAITGSVVTVDAEKANVGVVTNANQMLQGRVAGVSITQNNGEPGGGGQVRIRGGTSINASNEPLYVIDGVPISNEEGPPGAVGIGSINPALGRSPLNTLNPGDIESITVLKDASATAIYGSRGANGVVLITTKRSGRVAGQIEYDGYYGVSTAPRRLDFATGAQYRSFVQDQVSRGFLPATALSNLGPANTNWEDEILRRGMVTNHNMAFSGGSATTTYRASLNYFDQKGVVLSNGLTRYQGRLNAQHSALAGRMQLGLNLTASRVNNDYAPTENTGGFLGGLFTNMAIFNPTYPVKTAQGTYFEKGSGAQDERNPVALARQFNDVAPEDRVLANLTGALTLFPSLVASTTVGVDNTDAVRRTYAPRTSPVGAAYGGFASQSQRNLQNLNVQQLLTYSPRFGASEMEVVGGYEYSLNERRGFTAQAQDFITDAFNVNNLIAGRQSVSPPPQSYRVQSRLASFFGRANYGFADRYFLTGVLRYDGSSRLAPGHQWEVFPALSGSWRISEEPFMKDRLGPLSRLALRAGWGKQGNQSVDPYQTKLLLRIDQSAIYPFGGQLVYGLRAAQVGNADLRWETATQTNVGIDYGLRDERVTGSLEFYQKNTKDLLLEVSVPQPAVVSTRIENVGTLRNRGVEASLDAQLWNSGARSLSGGLVFSAERQEVTSLGPNRKFILTGWVSGQGQSGQYSQRIMLGEPLGTFFGPRFVRVNNLGQQVFACKASSAGCTNGQSLNPTEEDKVVLGHANPDFTLGLTNNLSWGAFDASWLWHGEFGRSVFNNTALVYQTKSAAKQGRNFIAEALSMPDSISEPAKFSSRWVENGRFIRLQNVTVGYTFATPPRLGFTSTRVYLSGDNLVLLTPYNGYDPEVFVASGLASRGIDYLTYPRARTVTFGARLQF
ncbi:MAG TPA: TonB-dependent receptor [Gemmatimonadaceae bacterium]|nr:TonB-dependent receptor [Gemmatimonadaceae bacterium]